MLKSALRIPILLAVGILAVALLLPSGVDAQACKFNSSTLECLKPGSACVADGGATGKCVTSGPTNDHDCQCVAPPPPLLDPRCSSRSGTGTFTCTIEKPNVTQPETPYPSVLFVPGDVVEVSADGCVQTGGIGSTWKRYVNPSGDNSQRLYHGLIRVPTGTPNSASVRIKTVLSHAFPVTGVGVPVSQLMLYLGYEDDKYSDNGYANHDDGNGNQCQSDPNKGIDGGPAHVTITISRGVSPPDPSSRFDFDVLSTSLDPNGLPYNPQWSWQTNPRNQGITPHEPNTSICHNFSSRPTTLGIPSLVPQPDFADCTDQADENSIDEPDPLSSNAVACDFYSIYHGEFPGHLNWFPITLEGHASSPSHNFDDDYEFELGIDDSASARPLSVNGRDVIHAEFDSDETVDNFHSDEWDLLHYDVDHDSAKAAQVFIGHAIVTGMFGMDVEHIKSELHPVYALAIKRDNYENTPSDEVWLMFVRNQGDEGECSSQIWNSGLEDYTFRLPWLEGMTSVDVNWTKTNASFLMTEGASGPVVSKVPPSAATAAMPAGVYVSFHLGPAVPRTTGILGDPGATRPFVNGALHLIWSGGSTTVTTIHPPAIKEAVETSDEEDLISAAIAKLPPAQQVQVRNARATPVTRPLVTHRNTVTGSIKIITRPPVVPKLGKLHAIKAGPATRKLQRDAAEMRALCAATNNAPAGLPPTVCTVK